jgi:hypothetical protein
MKDGRVDDPHSLRRSAWASRATTAGVASLSLLAILVYVADEDPAAHACAGTQALETGVVRFYDVILLLNGWVHVGCARLLYGHEVPPRGPGSGVSYHLRGHFFIQCTHSSAFIDLCQSFD